MPVTRPAIATGAEPAAQPVVDGTCIHGGVAPRQPAQPTTPTNGAPATAAPGQGITCFNSGTMVVTTRGETAIETLKAGDVILTMHGAPDRQPVLRVDRSRIDLAGRPDPAALAPILIKAGALMRGAPIRDLRVSPGQGILLDGCLVPARLLVNGTTIIQESSRESVTYHYLWLKAHGLVIADGALTESSFEDDWQRDFDNGANISPMRPALPGHGPGQPPMVRCAPLLLEGPMLDEIRHRLALRAEEAKSAA
jgi:hypothetical protein